jgi:hypothetical protein
MARSVSRQRGEGYGGTHGPADMVGQVTSLHTERPLLRSSLCTHLIMPLNRRFCSTTASNISQVWKVGKSIEGATDSDGLATLPLQRGGASPLGS